MKISDVAKAAAIKLPPDVLMHPMPFPDRLDYAEKIIQEAINAELEAGRQWNKLLEVELRNSRDIIANLRSELVRLGGGGGVSEGDAASPAEKEHNDRLSDSA